MEHGRRLCSPADGGADGGDPSSPGGAAVNDPGHRATPVMRQHDTRPAGDGGHCVDSRGAGVFWKEPCAVCQSKNTSLSSAFLAPRICSLQFIDKKFLLTIFPKIGPGGQAS